MILLMEVACALKMLVVKTVQPASLTTGDLAATKDAKDARVT